MARPTKEQTEKLEAELIRLIRKDTTLNISEMAEAMGLSRQSISTMIHRLKSTSKISDAEYALHKGEKVLPDVAAIKPTMKLIRKQTDQIIQAGERDLMTVKGSKKRKDQPPPLAGLPEVMMGMVPVQISFDPTKVEADFRMSLLRNTQVLDEIIKMIALRGKIGQEEANVIATLVRVTNDIVKTWTGTYALINMEVEHKLQFRILYEELTRFLTPAQIADLARRCETRFTAEKADLLNPKVSSEPV
ncbi:MAG: DUF977 family protein [Bacteroidetes bacterium]|nr:DUF977 family protein [Bacteroidota bacterium]